MKDENNDSPIFSWIAALVFFNLGVLLVHYVPESFIYAFRLSCLAILVLIIVFLVKRKR
jgi:hypothetical protein